MGMQRQWNVTLSPDFEQNSLGQRCRGIFNRRNQRTVFGSWSAAKQRRARPNGPEITSLGGIKCDRGRFPAYPAPSASLTRICGTTAGALVNERRARDGQARPRTGAELMNQASNQSNNAPEYAPKGDADVRPMSVLFELAKKHYVEPRFTRPCRTSAEARWRLAECGRLCQCQVRWEAVRDSLAACHAP